MNRIRIARLAVLLLLAVCMAVPAGAEKAADAAPSLALPAFTQTECAWDEAGNLISETAKDLQGNPAVNSRGFARAEYSWDKNGNLILEQYFGLQGEPVNNDLGYARAEYSYAQVNGGQWYALTEDRYAADGSRADISGSYSYARSELIANEFISTSWYNAKGQLTRPTGGYAQIKYEAQPGDGILTVTKSYLDAEGNLLLGTEGAGKLVNTYITDLKKAERDGRVAQLAAGMKAMPDKEAQNVMLLTGSEVYSIDGKPVLGGDRWFRQNRTYDPAGNLVRIDNFDMDGSPILSGAGYATMINTYDTQNRVVRVDYIGTDGLPVKMINGYASVTYEYYGDNRIHFERYFGADGERTMITTGFSMAEHEYSDDSKDDWDYRVTFYDTLDRYTMSNGGFARQEWKYARIRRVDDKGNEHWDINPTMVEHEKDYGVDLQLIERKAGYAGLLNERNENGQVIRTTYMDAAWEPTRNDEMQWASIEFTYDSPDIDAPAVAEAYFDEKGAPCEGITGAYGRQMVYGGPKQNLLLSEQFLDAQGQPDTNVTHGASRVEYAFDGNMNQTAARYYDQNGKPFTARYGYAAILREYNGTGGLLWQATFDPAGALVATGTSAAQVHTYDASGHHTGEKHYGADGSALTQSLGYASVRYTYDADGNISSIGWFNAEDNPVQVNGVAKVEREYDKLHHLTYEINYGADLQPILVSQGYAARRMEYDPLTGMTSKVTYLDQEGKPVLLPAGYAA